jgi:hypothetical protein
MHVERLAIQGKGVFVGRYQPSLELSSNRQSPTARPHRLNNQWSDEPLVESEEMLYSLTVPGERFGSIEFVNCNI